LKIYLDSSFLVSLYCFDSSSLRAVHALRSAETDARLLLSSFAELEVVNAFELRLFRKQMSVDETRATSATFDVDAATGRFQRYSLPQFVFQRARQLSLETTATLGNRASDILHVAAALELGAEGFYSFDERQRNLARSMGLRLND